MLVDWKDVIAKILVGVVSAGVLAFSVLVWNFASGGGLIRALGGVTKQNFADIESKILALEQKTSAIEVTPDYFRIMVNRAHFIFPSDGNMNVGFDNGIVCFAANDRSRPNDADRKKCFP
jgi:hypothetical protein